MKSLFLVGFLPLLVGLHFSSAFAHSGYCSSKSHDTLNINNASVLILNNGMLFGDGYNMGGYRIPANGFASSIYSGGFWIGGQSAAGMTHLSGAVYRKMYCDFQPGPLDTAGNAIPGSDLTFDYQWKITRKTIDDFRTLTATGTPIPVAHIPPSVLNWPAIGNPFALGANQTPIIIDQPLAPFVDVDGDGIYDPRMGDFPDVPGDQAIFWVFNDRKGIQSGTYGLPLSIEVHNLAYAYSDTGFLNDQTFFRMKIINKSQVDYTDLSIGLYIDSEVGCWLDDHVGSSPELNMGYATNGKPVDGTCQPNYGSTPPVVGIKLLTTPKNIHGQQTGMTSFMSYKLEFNNSPTGVPQTVQHYLNYMRSTWKDGTPLTYGGSGYGGTEPARFMYPDNPADTSGWSECNAGNVHGDRSFVMGTGSFTMAKGEAIDYEFAVLWTQCVDYSQWCIDISCFKELAQRTQEMYDAGIIGQSQYVSAATPTKEAASFKLFPNPSTGRFFLQFSGKMTPSSNLEIEFTDLSGRTVARQRIEQPRQEIDLSGHSPGLYLYRITENGVRLGSGKAVVY